MIAFSEAVDGLDDDDRASQEAMSQLLLEAVDRRASDLFFLAERDSMTVAIRRLGLVETLREIDPRFGRQMVNVVKNLACMDLVERRRPMDGRITARLRGGEVDIRVSTLPTLFGEDVTLRLLDPREQALDLDDLGLGPMERRRILELVDRPSGSVLVTGPTGAGKTTTQYACLNRLNDGVRKINTIEEPIEYSLAGIRQSQVNRAIGLDFAQLLASVLRQAPDVVMIGEVRDAETADAAVRAANSGHLVFATLHAPIAAGAVQSLIALGVAPHFLASSLAGVIAQRLVRRLCPDCRVRHELPGVESPFEEVADLVGDGVPPVLHGPAGCDACDGVGYVGRCGVFEILRADDEVRRLVAQTRSRDEIHAAAVANGMITFRRAALTGVALGRTSVEEVTRVFPRGVWAKPTNDRLAQR